jgi:programmed cell death 6-interacting protein
MLAVPFSPPENPVLNTSGFANFLKNRFFDIPKTTSAADVSSFAQIRRDALVSIDEMVVFTKNEVLGRKPSVETQKTIIRYCYTLKTIIPRLSSYEKSLELSFKWKTAFHSEKSQNSNKFVFDWACCMWNLGAAETLMGATLDRSTEEGIKAASRHFQVAAGYFDCLLKEDLCQDASLGPSLLPCLSKDALMMTKQLCLAQAQLCFYEKAVKDRKTGNMKAAIIAKIAMQTSKFYQQASASCALPGLASILDLSWFALTDFQSKVFMGAAEFWQSIAAKERAVEHATGYGEEVVRLRRAQQCIKKALALSERYSIAASLLGGAEGLLQKINADEAKASTALTTIYMESLPTDSSLIELSPVAMVKAATVPEYLPTAHEPRLFSQVVPKETQEANKKLLADVEKMYLDISGEAEGFTYSARTTLRTLNLPAAFESYMLDSKLPEGVWLRVEKMQKAGGIERLVKQVDEIESSANRANLSMSNIEETLQREEKKDDDFRGIYTELNTSHRQGGFIADMRYNTQNMRKAYNDARKNEDALFGEIRDSESQEEMKLLLKSKSDLTDLLPSKPVNLLDFDESESLEQDGSSKTSNSQSNNKLASLGPHAVQLEDRLHQLDQLLKLREAIVEGIRQLADKDKAMAAVDSVSLESQHVARDEYLTKAKGEKSRVMDTVEEQEELLKTIKHLNQAFLESIRDDPTAAERAEVLQTIERQLDKYFSLQQRIIEGVTFYANLQSKLNSLQQGSDDHAYIQEMQRHEFERNRETTLQRTSQEAEDRSMAMQLSSKLNMSQQGAVPPPAPAVAGGMTGAAVGGVGGAGGAVMGQAVANPHYGKVGPSLQQPSALPYHPPGSVGSSPVNGAVPAYGAYNQQSPAAVPSAVTYGHQQQSQPAAVPYGGQQQPAVSFRGAGMAAMAATSYPGAAKPALAAPYGSQPGAAQQMSALPYHPPGSAGSTSSPVNGAVPAYGAYNQQSPVAVPSAVTYGHQQQSQPAAVPYGGQQQPAVSFRGAGMAAVAAAPYYPGVGGPAKPAKATPSLATTPWGPPQAAAVPAPNGYHSSQNPNYQEYASAVPVPSTTGDFNEKLRQLCEMGFDQSTASAALTANSGNQEAALNSLLGGNSSPARQQSQPSPHQPQPQPAMPQAPQYGQPVYGSQQPVHGSQQPVYGSQQPVHGSNPMHGQPAPAYGNQQPVYGSPVYGNQPAHSQQPIYGTPIQQAGYGQPQHPFHHGQQPAYGQPYGYAPQGAPATAYPGQASHNQPQQGAATPYDQNRPAVPYGSQPAAVPYSQSQPAAAYGAQIQQPAYGAPAAYGQQPSPQSYGHPQPTTQTYMQPQQAPPPVKKGFWG